MTSFSKFVNVLSENSALITISVVGVSLGGICVYCTFGNKISDTIGTYIPYLKSSVEKQSCNQIHSRVTFSDDTKECLYDETKLAIRNLKKSFLYILGSIVVTGGSAYYMTHYTQFPRLFDSNNWKFFFGQLAVSIPLMCTTYSIDYKKRPILKHISWTAFWVSIGTGNMYIFMLGNDVLNQAMLATTTLVGGLTCAGLVYDDDESKLQLASTSTMLSVSVIMAFVASMLYPDVNISKTLSLYSLVACSGVEFVKQLHVLVEKKKAQGEEFDPINSSMQLSFELVLLFNRITNVIRDERGNNSDKKSNQKQ
jgi:hypothetical protein